MMSEKSEQREYHIDKLHERIAQLEADLTKCKKLAGKYIYEYEKFALENGLHELRIAAQELVDEIGCLGGPEQIQPALNKMRDALKINADEQITTNKGAGQ